MFHTIMLISYLIPGVYLFVRIWQLFIAREHRLSYILAFGLLFSIFPLSNFLDGNAGRILETVSGYLLPFLLYVFLLVLLTDLLLIINLIFRIFPQGRLKNRQLRYKVLGLIIVMSVIIVAGGIINFNTIRLSGYQIEVDKKSSELDHLRIALVSDFHLQNSTPRNFVKRFVEKVRTINPDLLLFVGDIVEGNDQNENIEKFEEMIGSVRTRFGVYGVLGNHEHYSGQDKGGFFGKAGITILRDSSVIIDNSFILAGRNDSRTRNRKSVADLMRSIPDTLPVILMDHRPTEIEEVSTTKAGIQFSGHTHNGQLFPIHLITNRVYLLSWGHKKYGETHFFVSSGIRLWGPPVRTIGKSEIMVVDVKFKGGIE